MMFASTRPTMAGEVKESRHLLCSTGGMTRIRETTIRSAKLVEEWVHHGIDGREALSRSVFKKSRDKFNCILSGFAENLDTGYYPNFETRR